MSVDVSETVEVCGGCPQGGLGGFLCEVGKEILKEVVVEGVKSTLEQDKKMEPYRNEMGSPSVLYDHSHGWYDPAPAHSGGAASSGGGGGGSSVFTAW